MDFEPDFARHIAANAGCSTCDGNAAALPAGNAIALNMHTVVSNLQCLPRRSQSRNLRGFV